MEAYRPELIDFDIDLIGFWYVPERVPESRNLAMDAYKPELMDFDIDLIGFWYVPERVPES